MIGRPDRALCPGCRVWHPIAALWAGSPVLECPAAPPGLAWSSPAAVVVAAGWAAAFLEALAAPGDPA